MNELQSKLQQFEGQAEADINSHIQRVQDGADLAIKEIQISVTAQHAYKTEIPENAATALSEAAIAAKNKPEIEYTFNDWNNRAFDAYRKDDKERAARFWRDAAEDDSATPEQVAVALSNAAAALTDLKRYGQAIEIYDEIIKRFDKSKNKAIIPNIANALNGKASCLSLTERNDEADLLLDKIISRFNKDEVLSSSAHMALAITNKIISLTIQEKSSDALNLCDEFIERFDATTDLEIIGHLITVRYRKIALLWPLDRMEEANLLYEHTLQQFGKLDDLEISKEIGKLKNTMAFILLCQAKGRWCDDQYRNDNLRKAASLLEESIAAIPGESMVLRNQAYCNFLLGETEESTLAKLTHALRMGGKHLYSETLNDIKISPVAEKDEIFLSLLNGAWLEVQS